MLSMDSQMDSLGDDMDSARRHGLRCLCDPCEDCLAEHAPGPCGPPSISLGKGIAKRIAAMHTRDMTTATEGLGLPLAAKVARVVHENGPRVSWVGLRVRIVCERGEVWCDHEHGHRTGEAARKCAQSLVDRINREARR